IPVGVRPFSWRTDSLSSLKSANQSTINHTHSSSHIGLSSGCSESSETLLLEIGIFPFKNRFLYIKFQFLKPPFHHFPNNLIVISTHILHMRMRLCCWTHLRTEKILAIFLK